MPPLSNAARQRASKACVRCNKRKLKCDAVQRNGPCSRCRMDRVDGCMLVTSRRGTYVRKRHHRRRNADNESSHDDEPRQRPDDNTKWLDDISTASSETSHTPDQANDEAQHSPILRSGSCPERHGLDNGNTTDQFERMLFGGQPPPTCVPNGSIQSQLKVPHKSATGSSCRNSIVVDVRGSHPSHCSPEDLDYLSNKGAFMPPAAGMEKPLVHAFLERFCPIYPVVNKEVIVRLHQRSALPFVLLHAICLIGGAFCDMSVIYMCGFESRREAGKSFYDKAKALCLLDYEKDETILIQTAILMSFWGPHADTSWTPCSWIGFGVTVATSIGMYKTDSASHTTDKDRGLKKRMWWILVARDSYCAALMGRPARVDMSQYNSEPLSSRDFPDTGEIRSDNQPYALYQISIAQLSLLIHQINAECQKHERHNAQANDLYDLLQQWRAQLPSDITFNPTVLDSSNIPSTSLELLFHSLVIFLHLQWPEQELLVPEHDLGFTGSTTSVAYASAQSIASIATSLLSKQSTSRFPLEVFISFHMASIIFRRQIQRANSPLADAAYTSLADCQLLLHEVREIFDPNHWIGRSFDFPLSPKGGTDGPNHLGFVQSDMSSSDAVMTGTGLSSDAVPSDGMLNFGDMYDQMTMDWHMGPEHDILADYDDTWFLQDILS